MKVFIGKTQIVQADVGLNAAIEQTAGGFLLKIDVDDELGGNSTVRVEFEKTDLAELLTAIHQRVK